MFTIISFFQKLIRAGGGWKIFQKLISGGGTIIRYSRVINEKNKTKNTTTVPIMAGIDARSSKLPPNIYRCRQDVTVLLTTKIHENCKTYNSASQSDKNSRYTYSDLSLFFNAA